MKNPKKVRPEAIDQQIMARYRDRRGDVLDWELQLADDALHDELRHRVIQILERWWRLNGNEFRDWCDEAGEIWWNEWPDVAKGLLEDRGITQGWHHSWQMLLYDVSLATEVATEPNEIAFINFRLLILSLLRRSGASIDKERNGFNDRLQNGDSIDREEKNTEKELVTYFHALTGHATNAKQFESMLRRNAGNSTRVDLLKRFATDQKNHLNIVPALAFSIFWIRDPLKLESTGPTDLIDYLYVQHEPPQFLYSIWQQEFSYASLRYYIWFIAYAQGISLEKVSRAAGWRVPTKFWHYLKLVPSGFELTESVVFAEILRMGGTELDFQRLRQDPSFIVDFLTPGIEGSFLKFWRDTIAWLIKHRDAISDLQSTKVLAWAQHCYTEGNLGRQSPFSWKRRSPSAAIQAGEAYFEEVNRPEYDPNIRLCWKNHGLDWDYTNGFGPGWTMRELVTGAELFDEGSAMSHCVGRYASLCAKGWCAIFSLCLNGERISTIELDLATKQVVQVRGKHNQLANSDTLKIIELWRRSIVITTEIRPHSVREMASRDQLVHADDRPPSNDLELDL